jgi:hypothetical protein
LEPFLLRELEPLHPLEPFLLSDLLEDLSARFLHPPGPLGLLATMDRQKPMDRQKLEQARIYQLEPLERLGPPEPRTPHPQP